MTAILNTLLEITIYSAVLYGAILIFRGIFRRHISAVLNFAVWGLLIIRLLIPVTVDSGFSLVVISSPAAPAAQNANMDDAAPAAQTIKSDDIEQTPSQETSNNSQIPDNIIVADRSPKQASSTMDWQAALIWLWAAGIVCSLALAAVSGIGLSRHIKRSSREIPVYIHDIIEECRKDLHIKRELKVTMHDWLNSPALTASPRPRLLLSSSLLTMNRQQIEFGIRHELTHYKRKDHLMILLLIFLRSIHWFNPIVWLSFPQIQTDLETLCDASVTSGLQKTERVSYINAMVEFSRSTHMRYVLGMGQGRKTLEKRIRGMFMRKKTKAPVRMAALTLTCVMLAACFTTACQPTPADAVVVGKDMREMLDKAKAPHDSSIGLRERLSVPDRFTGSAQDAAGRFKAVMDADIVIPDVNDIPIVRVETQPFDHGTVEKIKDYFFDDGPYYDPEALSEETKTELIDILAKLKARKTELENKGMKPLHPELENGEETNEDSSPQSDASDVTAQMSAYNMLDVVNESIRVLEDKLPNALEQRHLVEVSDGWQIGDPSHERMYFAQLNPEGGMRTLNVYNGSLLDELYIENRRDYDPNYGFYFTEDEWNSFNDPDMDAANIAEAQSLSFPSITMEQARQTADDFLKQAGIEGCVCERNEKVIGGSGQTWGDAVRRGNLLKGYRLQYVRMVNNVPVTYTDAESAWGDRNDQSFFFWNYERITFIIDDRGIAELQWKAPYKMLDTVVDSAAMLPFSDIAAIFKDKIVTTNACNVGEDRNMTFTEVRLGLMRVTEQNSTKQGLLIPVWDFFGTYTESVNRDGENYTTEIQIPTRSYLTINAIDGAVIDRQQGY